MASDYCVAGMRAIRSFTVSPDLPEPLSSLMEIATNLRWSWTPAAQRLFRWIDADSFEQSGHDPMRVLAEAPPGRLADLAADPGFLEYLDTVTTDLRRYVNGPTWFQTNGGSLGSVAYLSPEFGIAEALPQYSGGLGVLAGDHLKAAGSLGVPLIGIGLLYRQGYFSQELSPDGWQIEHYPDLDPYSMALSLVPDSTIEVTMAGEIVLARAWLARVGRARLYLLDTDVEGNDPAARLITDRLYGGATEHRLRQEILLGVGGVRLLDRLGERVQVFHTNEGHAGFSGLERVRQLVMDHGLTFAEAVEAVRAGTVFTTHTPVPAGIDRFPVDLMEKYFSGLAQDCGVSFDELMGLGHFPSERVQSSFNMAVMGLRLAGRANGVSRLHGEVSREMFHPLWPDLDVDEVPIGHVTNGVHGATWVAPAMRELFSETVNPAWYHAGAKDWRRLLGVSDDRLWRIRQHGREQLVEFVRGRLAGAARPGSVSREPLLDPGALTIGFARRFATYKRATLLMSDPERLERLLSNFDRPVQLVMAGKAHPADMAGKEMIARVVEMSRRPGLFGRLVFVDNYDMSVARALYQGSDVWLNTPRRPLEACGTSGEKAALNGALNCSIRDGWWDEMFDGENGWAIPTGLAESDAERDSEEADYLFSLLENQIVPLFYDRGADGLPRGWLARVKHSLVTLGPRVEASRMVRDYVRDLYEPAAAVHDRLAADNYAAAKVLSAWKSRIASCFGRVSVSQVEVAPTTITSGQQAEVEVLVEMDGLTEADLAVEVILGPVLAGDELVVAAEGTLVDHGPAGDGRRRFRGSFTCPQAGRHGVAVRVRPHHKDLSHPFETGLVVWAS